ncbi:MAG: hypothetical protein HYV04_07680 [Deltaproteobacteria bacterium]|nr:hypothetical protein [Deltaproteobacteria bacterium]
MEQRIEELGRNYLAALREHVGQGGESSLARAYELGRQALSDGFGVVELAVVYQEALAAIVARPVTTEEYNRVLKTAGEFFTESLSPFEMTHRGFREANAALRRTNKALREVNAELEAFAYSVAHDLRAPLRPLRGFGMALLEDYGDRLDAAGRDYARRIVNLSERMDALILDLLAYSRVSRAEHKLDPVSLASIINDALAHMEEDLRLRGARVSVERPSVYVLGHRMTLVQVVTNLLSNALKFVPEDEKPEVRIWAEERSGCVRLWVKDNGIGISPDQQGRIFGLFQRLHPTDAYPGLGVGLAIVWKAVAKMDGRVGVESSPGKGSAFWVELRHAEDPPSSAKEH